MRLVVSILGRNYTMDPFPGTLLTSEDVSGDTPIPYDVLDLRRDLTDANGFFIGHNASSPPIKTTSDSEYTQTMSVLAFSSLVLFGIIAYIFSKHCFNKNKPQPQPGDSRPPPQFNFLGSRGVRVVATSPTTNAALANDLPPSYDELFPPDSIIVESRNPSGLNPTSTTVEDGQKLKEDYVEEMKQKSTE